MAAKKNGTVQTRNLVEKLFAEGRWVDARRTIEVLLPKHPEDHWLLTRLSTTYYELGDYEKALGLADHALTIAPTCPLVLWDRAGALDMLGREKEALDIYTGLIRRGPKMLAEDECGEGEEWASGLIADCVYRSACSWEDLGERTKVASLYRIFLHMLDLSVPSIYDREEAAARLRALMPEKDRLAELREALQGVRDLVAG